MTAPRLLAVIVPLDGFDGFLETVLDNPETWAAAREIERSQHGYRNQVRFQISETSAAAIKTHAPLGPAMNVPLRLIAAELDRARNARAVAERGVVEAERRRS